MSSFARILPFVKPIEHLLLDPTVTEVMVNSGGRRVFVERAGVLEEIRDLTVDERNLKVAIKNIARTCGDEISDAQPILVIGVIVGAAAGGVAAGAAGGGAKAVFSRARSPFGRSGVPGDDITAMIFAMTPDANGSASVHLRKNGLMSS